MTIVYQVVDRSADLHAVAAESLRHSASVDPHLMTTNPR
jgi:hypothetical protein